MSSLASSLALPWRSTLTHSSILDHNRILLNPGSFGWLDLGLTAALSSNHCFFGILHGASRSLARSCRLAFERLYSRIWWHSINVNLREPNEGSAIMTELTWQHFTRGFAHRATSRDNRRRSVPFTGRPSSAPGLRPSLLSRRRWKSRAE